MQQRHRVALGLLGALVVLAGLASNAGAFARMRVDRAGLITGESVGRITFTAERIVIRCPLAFGGELIPGAVIQRPGIPVGELTEVVAENRTRLRRGRGI
jgi:hypothetical protein